MFYFFLVWKTSMAIQVASQGLMVVLSAVKLKAGSADVIRVDASQSADLDNKPNDATFE